MFHNHVHKLGLLKFPKAVTTKDAAIGEDVQASPCPDRLARWAVRLRATAREVDAGFHPRSRPTDPRRLASPPRGTIAGTRWPCSLPLPCLPFSSLLVRLSSAHFPFHRYQGVTAVQHLAASLSVLAASRATDRKSTRLNSSHLGI